MSLYEKLPAPRSVRVLSFKQPALNIEETLKHLVGSADGFERLDPRAQAVHCQLSVISLDGQESFDALSYVWGDPSVKSQYMFCNGQAIPITFNLWVALRQIWGKWPQKRLWVDAICINQNDIPERNKQVSMMGSIYSTAALVVVWLGEATQESKIFFKLKNGGKPSKIKIPLSSEHTNNRVDDSTPNFKRYVSKVAEDIVSRPWFGRAWTVQEIQLATKAIFCCGPDEAGMKELLRNIRKFDRYLTCAGDRSGPKIKAFTALDSTSGDVTLWHLLANTKEREASDARDKVYSLLSLLPRDLYDFMEADYSLSVAETFTWASRVCIEVDREFNCLAGARHHKEQHRFLPSWVPDWRDDEALSEFKYFYKKLGDFSKDPELLRLRLEHGRRLDRRSMTIEISGTGIGRIEIDKVDSSNYLVAFPECAIRAFKPLPSELSLAVELSRHDFFDFCKKTYRHDIENCNCMNNFLRIRQDHESIPKDVKEGDWIWSTATSDIKFSERDYYSGYDGGIQHYQYVLRPGELTGEVTFQLVQKLKWNVRESDQGVGDDECDDADDDDKEEGLTELVREPDRELVRKVEEEGRENRLGDNDNNDDDEEEEDEEEEEQDDEEYEEDDEYEPISNFVRIRTSYVLV